MVRIGLTDSLDLPRLHYVPGEEGEDLVILGQLTRPLRQLLRRVHRWGGSGRSRCGL